MINILKKVRRELLLVLKLIRIKINNKKHIIYSSSKKISKKRKYYIIRFEDKMHCGWTVWERIVLFNCIYAQEHNMVPVVDMQTNYNIYLDKEEVGKINAWDRYYEQPCFIDLETALSSNDYILGNPTQEWFDYLRLRKGKLRDNEFLKTKYQKYIRLNLETKTFLEEQYQNLLSKENLSENSRLLGICVRGSDYKLFNHPKQPETKGLASVIKTIYSNYQCNGIFIATEDREIFHDLKNNLSEYPLIFYNAGEVDSSLITGYVGDYMRAKKSADQVAKDYLVVLYALNKCKCLIGGTCGATIVAQYKREKPYDYMKIINLNEHY